MERDPCFLPHKHQGIQALLSRVTDDSLRNLVCHPVDSELKKNPTENHLKDKNKKNYNWVTLR
jgi:hypothetical protein